MQPHHQVWFEPCAPRQRKRAAHEPGRPSAVPAEESELGEALEAQYLAGRSTGGGVPGHRGLQQCGRFRKAALGQLQLALQEVGERRAVR